MHSTLFLHDTHCNLEFYIYLTVCLTSIATRREKAPWWQRICFEHHCIYRTQCDAWFIAEQVETKRHLLIIYNFVGDTLWSTTENFSKGEYMGRDPLYGERVPYYKTTTRMLFSIHYSSQWQIMFNHCQIYPKYLVSIQSAELPDISFAWVYRTLNLGFFVTQFPYQ